MAAVIIDTAPFTRKFHAYDGIRRVAAIRFGNPDRFVRTDGQRCRRVTRAMRGQVGKLFDLDAGRESPALRGSKRGSARGNSGSTAGTRAGAGPNGEGRAQ